MSSNRGYLTVAELKEIITTTLSDEELTALINLSEESVDNYVGFQNKFIRYEALGLAVAGSTSSLTLQLNQQTCETDYFKGCMVEILGGTGSGQKTLCTGNTSAGVLTLETLTTAVDGTSFYKIYQLGKFPRIDDCYYDSENTKKWYKSIPDEIKQAVVWQVEYIIEMGDSFFASDKSEKKSEDIGDYSYTNYDGSGLNKLMSPKSKTALIGIRNRKGYIIE